MVRISFGCYNDRRDVDVIVAALEQIVAGDIAGDYREDIDGSYAPAGYTEPVLFSLDAPYRYTLKRISRVSPSWTS